jgi:hypothetical protein
MGALSRTGASTEAWTGVALSKRAVPMQESRYGGMTEVSKSGREA